jgi:hypothetical protein
MAVVDLIFGADNRQGIQGRVYVFLLDLSQERLRKYHKEAAGN